MKTLYEHNREIWDQFVKEHRPNGLACPKCGKELVDVGVIQLAQPPQYGVLCESCGFTGDRYV